MNEFFEEHKNTFIGLLLSIIVIAVVSLIRLKYPYYVPVKVVEQPAAESEIQENVVIPQEKVVIPAEREKDELYYAELEYYRLQSEYYQYQLDEYRAYREGMRN